MKKVSLILLLTLCLSSLVIVASRTNHAYALESENVLYVGVGQGFYSTIQAAVDKANASETVFVYNGTYNEHVNVTKTISLVGQNRETTIIDSGYNGTAIKLNNANDVSVRGFTLRNGGGLLGAGIFIDNSNNNQISDNKMVNNSDAGIRLEQSRNNIIFSNIIESNFYGIVDTQSSINNIISGNSLNFNDWGIWITVASSGNIIYHNNFNNTNQLFTTGELVNLWDHGGEGNYWSGYQGLDSDKDGIGDTPYPIFGNNKDNYPLMGKFYGFDVSFQEQDFNVAIISNSSLSDFLFELGPETGNRIIQYYTQRIAGTHGFSRVRIPRALMDDPYTVIAGEEVNFTLLPSSNSTYADVYFTYNHASQTVTILTSETMRLYTDLLKTQSDLERDLETLNSTYQMLLRNYSDLLGNYNQLQRSYGSLSNSSQSLLGNSYQSEQNIRSLSYIFAAIVAVFIMVTIYLSKREHEPSISGMPNTVDAKDNAGPG